MTISLHLRNKQHILLIFIYELLWAFVVWKSGMMMMGENQS